MNKAFLIMRMTIPTFDKSRIKIHVFKINFEMNNKNKYKLYFLKLKELNILRTISVILCNFRRRVGVRQQYPRHGNIPDANKSFHFMSV